jgi:hypothetical protein
MTTSKGCWRTPPPPICAHREHHGRFDQEGDPDGVVEDYREGLQRLAGSCLLDDDCGDHQDGGDQHGHFEPLGDPLASSIHRTGHSTGAALDPCAQPLFLEAGTETAGNGRPPLLRVACARLARAQRADDRENSLRAR